MTRKEAMEWAGRYFDFATKAQTRGEVVSKLADLFQEATKGWYRIGAVVDVDNGTQRGMVRVDCSSMGFGICDPNRIRPIREKRPATREELLYNVRAKTGWRNGGEERFSTETLQAMARDLGIRTEVEVDE